MMRATSSIAVATALLAVAALAQTDTENHCLEVEILDFGFGFVTVPVAELFFNLEAKVADVALTNFVIEIAEDVVSADVEIWTVSDGTSFQDNDAFPTGWELAQTVTIADVLADSSVDLGMSLDVALTEGVSRGFAFTTESAILHVQQKDVFVPYDDAAADDNIIVKTGLTNTLQFFGTVCYDAPAAATPAPTSPPAPTDCELSCEFRFAQPAVPLFNTPRANIPDQRLNKWNPIVSSDGTAIENGCNGSYSYYVNDQNQWSANWTDANGFEHEEITVFYATNHDDFYVRTIQTWMDSSLKDTIEGRLMRTDVTCNGVESCVLYVLD